MLLILVGLPIFAFGVFLAAQHFPGLPSGRGEVTRVTLPVAVGAALLAFGAYGW